LARHPRHHLEVRQRIAAKLQPQFGTSRLANQRNLRAFPDTASANQGTKSSFPNKVRNFAHHFSGQLKIDETHIINLGSLLRVSMSEYHGA
jgi:hypothetical protein